MNLQDTVAQMFPTGVVTQGQPEDGRFFEVHGLAANASPQNCAVLASGQFEFSSAQGCQDSYLVKADDFVLFVRICPTQSGGRYAEVALRSRAAKEAKTQTH